MRMDSFHASFLKAKRLRKMDAGKGSRCSTNAADDFQLARAGGVGSCTFAPEGVESCVKATQVYPNNFTLRSGCKSSAALQSCWVQRLNLFHSISDAEEEVPGRKPPGKDIHVWTHFAKDFSSCRRPGTVSHSRSSSWPPDGLTGNEELLRMGKLPSPSASRSGSHLLVPSEELSQSCDAGCRAEHSGVGGKNRRHSKSGSPREARVPCLQSQCLSLRTNVIKESLDVEGECKFQNLAAGPSVRTAGDCQVSLSNTPSEVYLSRLETRNHLLPMFGSESDTASPAIRRGDYRWKVPGDLDAQERVLSMYASASKVENRGARADADGRLLVSPADVKKDKVIGRPKRVATGVFSTVDAEGLDQANPPVEIGENTVLCSNASQIRRAKDRLSSQRISKRESSRKSVLMRSEAGKCIDFLGHASGNDKRVAENRFRLSRPYSQRVWHGLSDGKEEKHVTDSKTLLAFARQHATVRSRVPEASMRGCWKNGIHDFEDSGHLKTAESFSSTASFPLDNLFEENHRTYFKEAMFSKANYKDAWSNERMPGLHRPVNARVEIQFPHKTPEELPCPRLWNDSKPFKERLWNESIPLKEERQIYSEDVHRRGVICASSDEESCEKFEAWTSLPDQNLHFPNEASGRTDLRVNKNTAARIQCSNEPTGLYLSQSKQRLSSRVCNDHTLYGVPSAQQAWIQRWSSFLNSGSGSFNLVSQTDENNVILNSDFPQKSLPKNCIGVMLSTNSNCKEKSYLDCAGPSLRECSKEGRRTMDGMVAHGDCGFKYILGSCLPTRNSHGKYLAPKAQAMAMVGAARQMDNSPIKKTVSLPIANALVHDLQAKGTPEEASCSSGGNADVDMDIFEFLGS